MPVQKYTFRPGDGAVVKVEGTPPQLTLQTKAGTPTDADIVGGAADGDIIVDTSALKLWVRMGGAWKQTVALS